MKNDSFVASRRSFSKLARSRFETYCFFSNNSLAEMFMVSCRGMLVNNEVMSRLAIKQSEFCCSISLAKSNESLILYSLKFKSLKYQETKISLLLQFTINPHLEEYFLILTVSFPEVINTT